MSGRDISMSLVQSQLQGERSSQSPLALHGRLYYVIFSGLERLQSSHLELGPSFSTPMGSCQSSISRS